MPYLTGVLTGVLITILVLFLVDHVGTEAGQCEQSPLQVFTVLGLGPDPAGVAVVLLDDDSAHRLDAFAH